MDGVVIQMYGKGLLKGLGITFKHTFEPAITIQYPEQMPFLQERFRGCLAFDFKKCIVCGLCTKACPNNVLKLETEIPAGSKKKQLVTYTIDLQYCMFCNLCVEACPASCLYFTHDFELTKLKRDDIKIVYQRPAGMEIIMDEAPAEADTADAGNGEAAAGRTVRAPKGGTKVSDTVEGAPTANANEGDEDAARKQKQVEAMKTALGKNPQKVLGKVLESEEDAAILAGLLAVDDKKLAKIAELMVEDRDKAARVAQAFVNKEKKDRPANSSGKEGGEEA